MNEPNEVARARGLEIGARVVCANIDEDGEVCDPDFGTVIGFDEDGDPCVQIEGGCAYIAHGVTRIPEAPPAGREEPDADPGPRPILVGFPVY